MEIRQLDHSSVLSYFPDRAPQTHKGNYGKLLLLCGSKGYTGAAALAAMGSLRVGAGLVYLAVPECIYEIEAIKYNDLVYYFKFENFGGWGSDKRACYLYCKNETSNEVFLMQFFVKDDGLYKMEYPLKEKNIQKSAEKIKKVYDKYLHPNVLPQDNEKMWDALAQNKVIGCFQFEGTVGQQAAKKIRPRTALEMADANGLMRLMTSEPGAEMPLDKYVRYKNNINWNRN